MSKKGLRLMLLLVVAAVLLAGFLVLFKKNQEQQAQQQEEEDAEDAYGTEDGELLYSFDYEDMKTISFTYQGTDYSFTKTEDTWSYDADPAFPVHQAYMEVKAAKLAEIYVDREVQGSESSLADFGLEDPEVSVTLTLTDGETYTFLMGDRNSTADAYYMYDVHSGKYYLRDGSFIVAFGDGFDLYDLAELESVPVVSSSEITHIYVNGTENKNMDNLASAAALEFSRAIQYNASDEDMETYGLAEPETTLTITYNKTVDSVTTENSYTLLIGKQTEEGDYYACLEGSREVSTVEASKIAFLSQ